MRLVLLILAAAVLSAADDLARFTDARLNPTQRNEACLLLRGNTSPDVIKAMRDTLEDMHVQACAGKNLRLAGGYSELRNALSDANPMVRAVAARELGATQMPEFILPLRKAAEDRDLLAQSNAIEGLVRYDDHSTAPQLREIALLGGIPTALALDTLLEWHDPEVAKISRQLVTRQNPGDILAAIRALGLTGNGQDIPTLRALAKDDASLGSGGRGFGLMPSISIARAATTAISRITQNEPN